MTGTPPQAPTVTLTASQNTARLEILKAYRPKRRHLLTGHAGSGKTTLMQRVVQDLLARKLKVAVTAPTHKAVAVLARKMAEAGVEVPCLTIHSLLSLEPKPGHDGRMRLERRKWADPVDADAVIIDEASMVSAELLEHIDRHLFHAFVLYVGDPAQLPPIGEVRSATFETQSRSHLAEVLRQQADNPVLAAATTIRESQARDGTDWSWCRPAAARPYGVYVPRDLDAWLRRAFTSERFAADNDEFRFICWTNARVAEINARVRRWIYGETETPLSPGEAALIRAPVIRDNAIIFATNEEAPVESIAAGTYRHTFPAGRGVDAWTVEVPTWEVELRRDADTTVLVHMPRNVRFVTDVHDRLVSEARIDPNRWGHRVDFKNMIAELQAVYALTAHTSQGSTFGNAFLDVADMRRRERSNPLEMKQLLYTAATRPTTALILTGV